MVKFASKGQGQPVDATKSVKETATSRKSQKMFTAKIPVEMHRRMLMLKAVRRLKIKDILAEAMESECQRVIKEHDHE